MPNDKINDLNRYIIINFTVRDVEVMLLHNLKKVLDDDLHK
ncbi:MAG: hypothetical protein ACHP9Y_05725 [Gammaproteobacteria bacterium]